MMKQRSAMLGNYRSLLLLVPAAVGLAQPSNFSLPAVYSTTGEIRTQTTKLEKLAPSAGYSLLFSLDSPGDLGPGLARSGLGGRRRPGPAL